MKVMMMMIMLMMMIELLTLCVKKINSARCAMFVVLFDVVCDRLLLAPFDTADCFCGHRNISVNQEMR